MLTAADVAPARPLELGAPAATPVLVKAEPVTEDDGVDVDVEVSVPIDVEEPPPDSKPSGVGQKYVPKEEGAPAVMLGADVQAAESGTQLQIEAEHRARRAPTILRMQAFDLPPPGASAPVDAELFAPRRSRFGVVAIAGLVLAGGALALGLSLTRGSDSKSEDAMPATASAAIAPDTAAPAPPPVPPATQPAATSHPPEPEATATAHAPVATAAVDDSADSASKRPKSPATPAKPVSPAIKPTATHAAPVAKAAPATKPPAAKPASPSPKPGGKSMIVRENPF
jgi:hypothetical protein